MHCKTTLAAEPVAAGGALDSAALIADHLPLFIQALMPCLVTSAEISPAHLAMHLAL